MTFVESQVRVWPVSPLSVRAGHMQMFIYKTYFSLARHKVVSKVQEVRIRTRTRIFRPHHSEDVDAWA